MVSILVWIQTQILPFLEWGLWCYRHWFECRRKYCMGPVARERSAKVSFRQAVAILQTVYIRDYWRGKSSRRSYYFDQAIILQLAIYCWYFLLGCGLRIGCLGRVLFEKHSRCVSLVVILLIKLKGWNGCKIDNKGDDIYPSIDHSNRLIIN